MSLLLIKIDFPNTIFQNCLQCHGKHIGRNSALEMIALMIFLNQSKADESLEESLAFTLMNPSDDEESLHFQDMTLKI